MATDNQSYPATLEVDYPSKLDRATTFFRFILAIPILAIVTILSATSSNEYYNEAGEKMTSSGGGIITALFIATALMILFQQRYPRWWFDFNLELNRFSMRVGAYLLFLTDQYPSTVESQTVHLDVEYPNVKEGLNRWLPLVKWIAAFPHYVVLLILIIGVMFVSIFAWFAILFTGRYPKNLFDFVVGVYRWNLRVTAYALLLTTDKYPPFSLKA